MMQNRSDYKHKYIRATLTSQTIDRWNQVESELKKKYPNKKFTPQKIISFLLNEHFDKAKSQNKIISAINQLKFTEEVNLELLGEMYARSIRDVNKEPILSLKLGSDYLLVDEAKKKVKERVANGRQNKFSHKSR
ncbi:MULTISPECIES: hypothetical protein [Lactobacillus]|uniref:Uncharacterized protein n=1 Tax=Lactobacillus jensenii TaxID=109790 RepID=A0ABU9FFQ8_LACJE|nr:MULTISPECIES: hypothetical protein [Lactobacillus]KAA9235574.1 hypothetical protein F6I36_05395 [Lactobacillus jensenii]KAA9264090.1 hypothetical protein F6I21_06615 [Lactobacillus jensenii]MCF1797285.1 hypothetical protein [Lactobacillus mulieris]MCF1846906.1 hypothetical protein [Lactobacillus mulieris]MCF1851245.1 hypothetical protein [Lactobacillus jensenii]